MLALIFLYWRTSTHIAQLPLQNILRKSTSSCTGFLQAASRMQNDIIRRSSGTKNVRFTASWEAPREFPESIPKEGLRKITGTNIGEIKETSRSHSVINNPPWELLRKIMRSKREGIDKLLDHRMLLGKYLGKFRL